MYPLIADIFPPNISEAILETCIPIILDPFNQKNMNMPAFKILPWEVTHLFHSEDAVQPLYACVKQLRHVQRHSGDPYTQWHLNLKRFQRIISTPSYKAA